MESLLNEVADLKANFTKKRLQHMGVPVNIAKLLRAPFLFNTVAGCVIYSYTIAYLKTCQYFCFHMKIISKGPTLIIRNFNL